MTDTQFPGVDLDMLAPDMVKMFDRYGYDIPVAGDHVRPELPAFLTAITGRAAADDTSWEQEAMHHPGGPVVIDNAGLPAPGAAAPVPQRGRPPAMTWMRWFTSQGIQLGAATRDDYYWRCPVCRVWAGPYSDGSTAKTAGLDHRSTRHDQPAARRAEARKAARKVCKRATAAYMDELTARLASTYGENPETIMDTITGTATAIDGMYATHNDVLFYTGRRLGTAVPGDYGKPPHPKVRALVNAIATALDHPGWLETCLAADELRRERDRVSR